MTLRIRAVLFLLCLLAQTGFTQIYQLRNLGIEDGLSNSYILGITQDKNGRIWFATEEGLNKFDGIRITPYYTYSSKKIRLTGNELNTVFADEQEAVIWIGTQRAGLNAYNYEEDTFLAYSHDKDDPHSLSTNDITSIDQAEDGNIWVGTYHRGVNLLNKKTGQFIHYNQSTLPEMASNRVWTLLDGKDGHLYIGHVDKGLTIMSLKEKQLLNFRHDPEDPNSLPGNEVHAIFKDRQNNIWVGTNNGMALYNADSRDFFVFRHIPGNPTSLPSNRVYSINQYDDTKLIIATEFNGVSLLDLKRPLFMSLNEIGFQNVVSINYAQRLANATIRCVFRDSFDNLWLGTYGDGVHFIANDTSPFHSWSYAPGVKSGLNHKIAWGLYSDKAGRTWVGTDGAGIDLFFKGERIASFNRENGRLSQNSVLAMTEDSSGRLWAGTFMGGLHMYNPATRRFDALPYTDGLDIRCLYEDDKKQVWVGSQQGIWVISTEDVQKRMVYNTENTRLPENLIRCISQDKSGRICVGTFGGGLAIFSPDMQHLATFNEAVGFPSNTINDIHRAADGTMWIATGDGLVRFRPDEGFSFDIFGRNEGLVNTHIRAIAEDNQQNIWFSSNNGISCYNLSLRRFFNYSHQSSHIPAGNFMSGSVSKDPDGNIYFGSINGVCYFNPLQMDNVQNTPPVIITEFIVHNKTSFHPDKGDMINIPADRKIVLSHTEKSFRVSFSIQNFSLINQTEYAYRLKGFDNSWFPLETQHSVTFRNIPPGNYELEVKARNLNEEWPEEASVWHLRIKPSLWWTWWAKAAYILIAIFLAIKVIRSYKNRLYRKNVYRMEKEQMQQEKELNNERLRFFTNITHELRTPLSLILAPLEDLVHECTLPPKPLQKIQMIHQSALRLLGLINQILEFRKTETQNKRLCVSLDDITAAVRETGLRFKELSTNKQVRIELRIPIEPLEIYFDRDIIQTILHNLLSNALKYTTAGQIVLELNRYTKEGNDYTEIRVSDTGCGIPPEALKHIFDRYYQVYPSDQASGTGIGLALVKNLVELHEATIEVNSKLKEGTSFRIRLLTQNTYPSELHSEKPAQQETDVDYLAETGNEAMFAQKPILLIVEDNTDILNYIADSFRETFDVFCAENGKEGLDLAFSKIPDIIISDIMMPVMNGMDLCQILKDDIRTSHIPVILLTAKDSLSDKTKGYELGADSYITKPFSANLLRSRVNNLLESRHKLASLMVSNKRTLPEENALSNSLSKLDNAFIEKITAVIEENLSGERIDVPFLSEKMCMSQSTLYRKIKSLTTISTNEFVRKIRMRKAADLLRDGKYQVSEIAFMVGINNIKYFRQCFKEEYGVTPSEYQQDKPV